MERGQRGRNPRQKPVEKIDAAEESLHLHLGRWTRHSMDGVDLGRERDNTRGIDDMAQVRDAWRCYHTLPLIEAEARVRQALQNLSQVKTVLLQGGAGHEDVVQVDEDTRQVTQDAIHESLECLRRILQSEWHPKKFE